MILSKYTHKFKVDKNIYALYNSLNNKTIYVNKKELKDIKKGIYIEKLTYDFLLENGIIVNSIFEDNENYLKILNNYKKFSKKIYIMYLIISSKCNLNCKYCFVSENNDLNSQSNKNMSLETAIKSIEKYLVYIDENNIKNPRLVFYGGEPLIVWDIIKKCIEFIFEKNKKINISIITNGTLVTNEIVMFLKKYKINVGISIDGPKKINDFNRIFKMNNFSVYESAIKGYNKMESKMCDCGISITISSELIKSKDFFLEWLENTSFKNISYNLLICKDKKFNWKKYYKKASEFIIESFERLNEKGIIDARIKKIISSFINDKFVYTNCGSLGANQITIRPDGTSCVCNGEHNNSNINIGNINIDDLNKITDNINFKKWTGYASIHQKQCLMCEALFVCGGGCKYQADHLFGKKNTLDQASCIYKKTILRWLIKKGYEAKSIK